MSNIVTIYFNRWPNFTSKKFTHHKIAIQYYIDVTKKINKMFGYEEMNEIYFHYELFQTADCVAYKSKCIVFAPVNWIIQLFQICVIAMATPFLYKPFSTIIRPTSLIWDCNVLIDKCLSLKWPSKIAIHVQRNWKCKKLNSRECGTRTRKRLHYLPSHSNMFWLIWVIS